LKGIIIIVTVGILIICILFAGLAGYIAWDMGIHFWDDSQVPVISVSEGLRPVITFTPDAAFELNVYEGSEDLDGFDSLWYARGPDSSFENHLRSPVTYGVPPEGSEGQEAPPLEAGKTYTISIFRKDPTGGGDGFFNTRHRYVGLKTFVATE
jgi:hypothetical protein